MATSLPSPDRIPQKRTRTAVTAKFFTNNKNTFPRFHVIHSEHSEITARHVSPFKVARTLTDTLGQGYKIKKLANGDLLLEVLYQHQYENLPKITAFEDIPVAISPHRSLNTVRGVISDDDLKYMSEEELLNGLKDQNVTNVYRIKIKRENKEIETKHFVLTFASSILPDTVEVGYTRLNLRPYIPNPRRCYNCQRYGHGSQSCRGQTTCAKCASHEHASENCKVEPPHCVNCEGSHPAYSRACPTWKQEKSIITLKVKENITFREARKRHSLVESRSYSVVLQQGAATQRPTAPAQGTPSDAGAGLPAPKVDAARAAPLPRTQAPRTAGSASLKASVHTARLHANKSVRSVQTSSVSGDAMDTSQGSPGPSTSDGRRDTSDRKKDKPRITGPENKT